VNGQGIIGLGCAWCDLPAVGEVEISSAQYRTVTRRDPVTGARTSHQEFARAAIVVAVCDEHRHIRDGQPPAVAVPRQRTARDVDQLGLFATPVSESLR
jgi:hypothetical protein